MSYWHESPTDRGEHKHYTLMAQTRKHTNNTHIGYIMFGNLENEEDAHRLQTQSKTMETTIMENKENQ
eukprot:11313228-Heterocapsa_arctica.AAC.1